MPRRSLTLVIAALIASTAATIVAPGGPVDAAGTPPGCPFVNDQYRYCNRYTSIGQFGSIGLLGDSVLLGSADGFSNPGLPSMLSSQGWGPINLIATLGMRARNTSDGNLSAVYWLQRWHTMGFHPDVIALQIGNNNIGTWNQPLCTVSNTTNCKTQIMFVLNEIALDHPAARIWWPKVNHEPFGYGNGYSAGMLGWNKALDELAATRPNMLLWDWPSALLTANPPIAMDTFRVHPVSATQYVKRSTLMASHISVNTPWARYLGPRAPLPTATLGPLTYAPAAVQAAIYDTRSGAPLAAGETRDLDLSAASGVDPDAGALALTFTAMSPAQNGFLTVHPCGETRPTASNLNFAAGASRTAQVVTRVSAGHICVFASTQVHIVVSLQGNFVADGGTLLTPITPARVLDTRNTGTHADFVVDVPDTTAVATTVTVVGPSGGGTVTVYACDETVPDVANLSFEPGEVVASALFAPVSPAGTVCVHLSTPGTLPNVIVDITGTFAADTGLAFDPAPATRLLDTRNGTGGWIGRQGISQVIDVPVAPDGAQAVTATITLVWPVLNDFLTAFPCGQAVPVTSSVNARAGIVMANSVTVGVNAVQHTVCIFAAQNTHTIFDVVGWWVQLPA